MDINLVFLFKGFLGLALMVLSCLVIYFLFEIVRIIIRVRRLIDRIDLLTDVKGWWTFFRTFSKSRRKKNKIDA